MARSKLGREKRRPFACTRVGASGEVRRESGSGSEATIEPQASRGRCGAGPVTQATRLARTRLPRTHTTGKEAGGIACLPLRL